ncbi:hypothetical protein CNT_KDOLBLKC_03888 [Bacillus subtilis]|uniref:hypothetical protein n=1 Tax=Bacillus subtilis TaxID=1423 RepID=UPI001C2330B2|nr:hypothetical protein [Bacillus subtilis]MBU8678748.1 hypothetical protein [Bacillus subtilis]
MAERISLDTDNISLNELFKEVEKWESIPSSDLTNDQLAIVNLKRVIEAKDAAGDLGGGKECFICATGA